MIRVQIPGAPPIDVRTDDREVAAREAADYLRQNFPEQYSAWEREQPLPGFVAGVVRGARGALGSQVTGAGLQLEERGLPGGETLREAGTAIAGQPMPGERLLEAGTVLEDLRRRPLQTITTGLGQAIGGTLGSIAAPAAVALGTAAVAPAGVAGAAALGAGIIAGALSGTGELYEGLTREGIEPARARELAANIGAAIGAAEGGAAVPLVRQILGRTLREEAVERIAEIAGRSARQQAVRGGARAAVIEGGSEMAGGAARQAVIATETGDVDLARRAGEVLFEGALGTVGGGGIGAVSGARDPGRARAELEARLTPEERAARDAELQAAISGEPAAQAEVAPTPATPEPLVGERPQPFAAPDQAADYLAENPAPAGLRTPEAATTWANARRQAEWEAQVEAARPVALTEFTAPPTTPEAAPQSNQTFFGNIAEAAVTDQIRLTGFKPVDVARYAFESRGLQNVKPSKPEIEAVTQRLDSLVADNLLERTGDGVYRVSTQPATQAPAPEVQPAAPPPQAGPAPSIEPAVPPAPTQMPAAPQPPQTPQPGSPPIAAQPSTAQTAPPIPGAPPPISPATPGVPPPTPTPLPPSPPPISAAPITPPTEIPPTPAERTETPETQQAQQNLAEIAQTGNLATPAPPNVQASANLWRAYELAAGPETNNPIVIAAREVSRGTRRRLTLNQFQTFANAWAALPTDADRILFAQQVVQNPQLLGGRRAPVFQAPQQPPPPTVAQPTPAAPTPPQPAPAAPQPTPVGPQPTAQPAEQITQTEQVPEQPVTGFTTAQGSTYEVNELGQTIRTKRSPGRGQGQTYAPHNVLFVRPEDATTILDDMRGGGTYRFVVEDAGGPRFIEAGESLQGRRAALAVFNPDGTFNRYVPSQTTPAVGLAPVELRYEGTGPDRRSNRHVGNTITELNGPRPEPVVPQEAAAPPAEPEVSGEQTAMVDGIPSEAVAEDLSPGAETDIRETDNKIYSLLAGILPENVAQGRQIIARATRDTLFNKFTRGFFSPILTMPKWRPEMAAAGRVARFFLRRANQFNVEIQNLLARNTGQFNDEQRSVMARRLEQSSKDGKPFNRDGLTPEMIAKMEDIQRAGQRAFDYFVEANIIKFYDPAEAKTPTARAALEQMWRRNPNRNLSQISDADLRAGSPDGFKVKQELERLRNKFYLPMTSDGKTHFIAAYPKGPDGKRKPGAKAIAVVPLNPLAPKRRKPGVPDPEVLARQELTDRGITADRYYITPAPVEFTRDAEIASIRDNADFIASFVEKLRKSVGNNAEAQALLRDMQTSLDKARMQGILKPNQGILIPITRLNESTYLTKTVPQYYAGLGKLQARRYTEHSFQRAIKDLNPQDQAYWREHRDYMSAPAEAAWISTIRSFNFHWFMGAALDTAILNATQVYSSTIPLLVRDAGVRGATVTQGTINDFFSSLETGKAAAGRDIENYIRSLVRSVAKNPDEAQALARAARLEVFTPIFTTESGGVTDVNIKEQLIARGIKNPDKWQKGADILMNLSGLPQRTAETLNRSITFLAAYRLATQNPEVIERANRLDGYNFTGPNAAFEYAVSRVDDSQLITTAEDRAYFMRAFPGAELVTQFLSYPAKMAEIWFTQWRNGITGLAKLDPELARAGAIGLMLYSAPMIFFAGVWGLPFGEQLREGLEAVIKFLWKDVENFDDDLRYALGDGFWAKFFTRGFPHASGLANTSQRMAIDPIPVQEIADWTPLQLAGPIGGSLLDTVSSIYGYASRGDYFNALAAAMPRVIGNALKGANLEFGTGEYRSPQGNVIISRDQLAELDRNSLLPISVRQALGFQSPAVADLRTGYQVARETQTQNRAYAESLNNRLARTEADRVRALRDNNPEAAARAIAEHRRIIEEHGRRNEAFERAGERDKMYNPNMATIRRQALEMVYGRTSPEIMGRMGGPGTRGEIQEIARRYSPQ